MIHTIKTKGFMTARDNSEISQEAGLGHTFIKQTQALHRRVSRLPSVIILFGLLLLGHHMGLNFSLESSAHAACTGTTNSVNDADDSGDNDQPGNPCDPPTANDGPEGSGPPCGMAVWRVSEPYINLWIDDTPLQYRLANGEWMKFTLSYKQRAGRTAANAAGLGTNGWECNWIGMLVVTNTNTFVINNLAGGGHESFQTNGAHTYKSVRRLSYEVLQFGPGFGPGGSGTVTAIRSPSGALNRYGFQLASSAGVVNQFLSTRLDRYGRATEFGWATVSQLTLLNSVTDHDGRVCSIAYTNTVYPSQITSITDPYGRTARFIYDHWGRLTNIVDMIGMSSSFQYDVASGAITNLHTPYGNTGFRHFEGEINGYTLNRAIEISEPTSDKQLYVYRDTGDTTNGSFGGTFDCDESGTANRNSYHWDRKQFAAISNAGKTNYLDMPVADYLKASLTHFLLKDPVNHILSDTASATAGPVLRPDLGDVRSGQVFFKYQGQMALDTIGTHKRVTKIVWNGTSYNSGSSPAMEIGRNDWGRPTNITYFLNGTAYSYTNIFDDEGSILQRVFGPRGEQVRGYGYHPTITNLLTSVTNALGEVLRYTHNTNGMKVTSVAYAGGLVTTNLYYATGPIGFLAQTIDIGFRTNSFSYTNGNVYIHTNELGLIITNGWDDLNRLTSTRFPDGSYVSNVWDRLDLAAEKDRMNFWTRYGYNAIRQLVAMTNANGAATEYQYCGCGSASEIKKWNGSTPLITQFSYNLAGLLTNAFYPDGYQLNYTYDDLERMLTVLDSGGHQAEFGYNDYNQTKEIKVGTSPLYFAQREFDEYGRLIKNTDRNGVIITNGYDVLDRPVARRMIGASGIEMSGLESFAYNSRGLTNYSDPLGKITRYVRDSLSRSLFETNANLEALQFTYNPADQMLTLIDGKAQTTRWNYDSEGRVTNKVDAASAEMFRYQYDPNGRLTNRWQAGSITTTFRYDAVGSLTNIVYPTSSAISLRYDPLSRLTNMVDGIGSTAFTWTDGNQLAGEDGPWAADKVSYNYASRLRDSMTVQQPNTTVWAQSYGYDLYRRLTNVTSLAGTFSTQYKDSLADVVPDLVQRLDLPGGSFIENTQDDLGRLLSTVLKNSGNTALNSHTYEHNSGHQRTKQTFTAGNYTDYTYDNIGQLKTAKGWESDTTTPRWHEQMGYAYDKGWNLNYRTNYSLVQTFNVNNLNELTTGTRSGNMTVAGTTTIPATDVTVNSVAAVLYGDSMFARTNVNLSDGNNTFTAVAHDSLSREDTTSITAYLPATATYHYDARGNLTSDGKRGLTYDDENQLVRVTVTNEWKSEFSYDGMLRRRVRKEFTWQNSVWVQTNEVRYVYDGRVVIQERDANNVAAVTYTRGNDLSGTMQGAGGIGGLLARTANSLLLSPSFQDAHAYYHADGNGNITALIGTNQILVARYQYDPYGNTLAAVGPLAEANVYRFSSKEYQANSGLYYYGFRFHQPSSQRWLNRDPIGEAGGINLYQFSWNSPASFFDTFGLAPNQGEACSASDIENVLRNNSSLADLREESLENDQRYFYTDQYGWIDVRHFAEAARRVREGEPGWVTRSLGFLNEVSQWLHEWGDDYRSGFSHEDLPSNNAGIDFAQNISPLDKNLADSFAKWANANGERGKGDDRSGFKNLPKTDPADKGGKGSKSNLTSSKKADANAGKSCPSGRK